MSRLLLLEDDLSLIDGLKYSLEKNGFELDVARSVTEARKYLSAGHGYDLLLLDVTLPDGTGFMICEERRALNDMTPIIFLTAADEETSIIRGLDCGGDDYITKPFKARELISRIKNVLRRTGKDYSNVIYLHNVVIDLKQAKVFKNQKDVMLTALEYKILLILALNPNQVFTREKILSDIWDVNEAYVNDNTLTVYIKRIREKIEDDPMNPKIILTVRGMGYKVEI